MKNFFRFLMAAILVSMSATAVAQCIHPNAPGPPRIWDGARGCYVPQGTPQLGAPIWNGGNPYPYGVPQPAYGQPYGQPYGMPYGGVPVGVGLSNCAVVGGLAGGTLGSLAKHHRGQAVILGALIGGVVSQMVCINSQGQRVIMQQPPAQAVASVPQYAFANPPVPAEQQVVAVSPQQLAPASGQGTFCNIDGIVTHEVNSAACVTKAKAKAETLVSGKNVDMKHQAQAPTCSQGKTWSKLNWPDHPQHATYVCLPDGDPHRFIDDPTS